MARTRGPYSSDEETGAYARRGASARGRDDSEDRLPDPREFDDEPDAPPEFLRAPRRVPVRRRTLPKRWRWWLARLLVAVLVLGCLAAAYISVRRYALTAVRFRVASSDDIEFAGTEHVSRYQVLHDVLGEDIGRNVFAVPLQERRTKIEAIPWVQRAEVLRLLPNHLRVAITERTPVAFVALGPRIALIDARGVMMEYSAASHTQYSFPVIGGMSEGDPLATCAERMKIYARLMEDLDANGAHYSQDVSEVNLADPDDVKVTVADTGGAVLLHLGSDRFRARYELFLANVQKWRQSVPRLDSVDLRSDRQVIVNPDARPAPHAEQPGTAPPAQSTAAAQKPAKPKPETRNKRRHK